MVLGYPIVAAMWILAFDALMGAQGEDPARAELLRVLKEWGLVLASAALLYWLLRRMLRVRQAIRAREADLVAEHRRTRALLDAIVTHSSDAIFAKDVEGRYLLFNGEAARLTGSTPQQALGNTDAVIFGESRARALREDDLRVMARDRPKPGVEGFDSPGGRLCFMTTKGAVRSETGEVIGMFGITRDVTARARADEVAERWAQVFKSAGLGFALHDVSSNSFSEVNEAYARLHGYTADELRGRPILDVYAPEERGPMARRLAGIDQSGQQSFEATHLHKDGRRLPVLMGVTPVRDADGQVRSRFAYAIDYTEHKAAEIQLRKFYQAVEQSPESIVITNTEVEIEYVNEAFVRATGYTREEVIGQNPRVLQSQKTPARSYADLWDALRQGESWRGEFLNRRKDGTDYYETAHIAPIRNEAGVTTHYLAIKEDITDRKRLNEELAAYRGHLEELVERRTAELAAAMRAAEAASRAKSDFLATMSHEIRTPMNGVVGVAEILRQSNLSGYQVELVDTMRESAFNLLRIIDDVLDFSKIEAGRLELVPEPLVLRSMVEGVGDALQPMAARKKVDLRVFVSPDLPVTVLGDELRMRQILNNLVGNAIKFSAGLDHPGLVRIRAEAGAPGELHLQVSDNGIGMTPEVIATLFTPFTQAEASTTRRYGGTGLGLAICQRLLDLLDGRIEVASTPGEGSLFTVILPLVVPADAQRAESRGPLHHVHCVLVGADPLTTSDWERYLADAGARVEVRAGFDAAQAAIGSSEGAATVLVTDLASAGHDWQALRDRFSEQQAGIVVITRGSRRRPRSELHRLFSLDGDAMRRDGLIEAVELAARLELSPPAVPPADVARPPKDEMPVVPTPDEAVVAGRLILVAEDDPINRKVIERQLARLGFACEFGKDGKEALQRWRSGRHALLLTDLHMPEMDGYELTAAIRREESGGKRLPIIAVTANALRGEDARCKSAGMDDYLSKPVLNEVLRQTLMRWLPPADPSALALGPSAPAPAPDREPLATLDVSVLARLIGEDRALIDEFLQDFLVSAGTAAGGIRSAKAASAWRQVGAIAHQLKSSARSVGAMALGEICASLEQAGKSGHGDFVAARLPAFEQALARVVDAVEQQIRRR